MFIAATIALVLIALLHVYILVLEMFLWTKPAGLKAFNLSPEFAESTKTLGANQGLYNGFLAAGLIWGAISPDPVVRLFFLACVGIAGIFGAITVGRKILFIQTIPAVIAAGLVILSILPMV